MAIQPTDADGPNFASGKPCKSLVGSLGMAEGLNQSIECGPILPRQVGNKSRVDPKQHLRGRVPQLAPDPLGTLTGGQHQRGRGVARDIGPTSLELEAI